MFFSLICPSLVDKIAKIMAQLKKIIKEGLNKIVKGINCKVLIAKAESNMKNSGFLSQQKNLIKSSNPFRNSFSSLLVVQVV